jgi:hypothetical protein
MINLKFYCLTYSRVADKGLEIYQHEDSYDEWDNYADEYKIKFKKLDSNFIFPNIEIGKIKKPNIDFHFSYGLLIISPKAKKILEDLILPTCQILPFHEIKGEQYFAVHCFQSINCIDYTKSVFDYYPSSPDVPLNRGEPLYFLEDKVPSDICFFKVPLKDSGYYCKKEFVDRVIEHKLTGLGFRDPRIHELSSISGNAENPVPEVESFKLKK